VDHRLLVRYAELVARPVQRLLAGMPTQRPELAVHTDGDGRQLVVGDRAVVLFGPFGRDDLGMRNLAIVSLTQMGFEVHAVAAAFGLRPGTVSGLRTAFRRAGSAGVVKVSGRPARLDEDTVAQARALIEEEGWTQQQLGEKFGVTASAVSHALARHRGAPPADPARGLELPLSGEDHADRAERAEGTGPAEQQGEQADDHAEQAGGTEQADQQGERAGDHADRAEEPAASADLAVVHSATGDRADQPVPAPRIAFGTYPSRYAGVMLAHAYLHRAGVNGIFAELPATPWRRFDQAQVATFAVLALLLGVGSVEQVKTLIRAQAGPLTGVVASPGLDTLRPRLAGIADHLDVPALQTRLATAMLALPGTDAGLFYVDDHFVPYTGAKPVAMGHNGKRDRCEKGRADTLITDARGRAVCFTSADPTHLSKTMQPVLRQLRAIVPTGPVLLGFDRGGAYAEAFTACREVGVDFLTYRRGRLAPCTAVPAVHQVTRGRRTVEVTLADERIVFGEDYTGPCRQLTLFERRTACSCPSPDPAADRAEDQTEDRAGPSPTCPHQVPVLQVLTSDLTASAADLLFALKGRWVIENAFKYLDYYGIDWLVDYHADIAANTKLVDNPARVAANAAIRAARVAHAEAAGALGVLLTSTASAAEKNAAVPAAQRTVTDTERRITELTAARNAVPVRLPANVVNPDARRALQRTHRRGLLMALRLLAYNADTWLADHLDVYLQDPNEYRAITRSLMHQPGTITYTPEAITVTLELHHAPRVNRALTLLLDELNATPAHIPGDPRPVSYQLAGA
jgi:transposase